MAGSITTVEHRFSSKTDNDYSTKCKIGQKKNMGKKKKRINEFTSG
jgi:hypothetical protein